MEHSNNGIQTFSRQEVAKQLGVSVVTIDRAIAAKKIFHYKIGTRVRFARKHIEAFLQDNEQSAKPVMRKGLLTNDNN